MRTHKSTDAENDIQQRTNETALDGDFLEHPALFDNQTEERWLTTEEAARFLRISTKCLLNLCSNGKVRYYKLGRRNRFLASDLRKLLLAQPRGDIHGN